MPCADFVLAPSFEQACWWSSRPQIPTVPFIYKHSRWPSTSVTTMDLAAIASTPLTHLHRVEMSWKLEVLSIFTSGRASRPRWKSARPSFRVVDDSCKRQRTIVNFRRRAYAAVKKSRAVSIRKAIVTHYSEQLNIFSQSSYKLSLVDKMQADNLPSWKEQCRGGGGREGAEREREKKKVHLDAATPGELSMMECLTSVLSH